MFDIYRCSECEHSFLYTSPVATFKDQIYTDYYPRASFDLEKFKPKTFPGGFASWLNGDACSACRWVPPDVRVLDIGCGFCETLAYYQARGCEVNGVEVDENVKSVAERYDFDVHIGPFDPDCYPSEYFDYVTMQQVIEHVENPLETLQGVAKILRPGGHAVLTTPNAQGWGTRVFGSKWINWHAPYHRHFFSRQSMGRATQNAGMVVESAQTITSSEWLRYQWIHLLAFPSEGEPSAFWSPQGSRGLTMRIGQRLTEMLHYSRINHLLTRFFDSINMGDSLLFLLKKP